MKCVIDSGEGVNVIDSCSFNQLENAHLLPTSKKIYGYRSTEPLPVVKKFEAEVKSSVTGKSKVTQFCIVDVSDGNLIGCQTATDLGLLHIVNSVSAPTVDNIMEDYKGCFEGLGKIKEDHPDPKQSQNPSHLSRVDAYINFVTTIAVPPAVTLQEVKHATAADETLQSGKGDNK